MKKLISLVLALALVLACCSVAFAGTKITPATTDTGRIEITQSTNTIDVNGRVFRAYRLLDVQSKTDAASGEFATVAYTVPSNSLAFWTDNSKTGLSIDWTGVDKTKTSAQIDNLVTRAMAALGSNDSTGIKAFAEKAQAWASANLDYYEATGASDKVTFSNLPFGYYIIDDQTTTAEATNGTSVSAVIIDTATPAQSIVVKGSTIPSDKSITGVNTGETGETSATTNLEDNDSDNKAEVVDVSVGDIVHFKVDSTVPDTRGYNYYKFVVNDTLDKGLKLDKNTVKITIGQDEYTNGNGITVTTNPETVTGTAATTLTIVLNNALEKFTKSGVVVGQAIAITYDAELTEDAVVGGKVENKVTIDYTNNPKVEIDKDHDDFQPNDPKGTTPEKKTETYTTEITILKVDEDGKPLSGAEFTLSGTTAHNVVIYDETFQENTNGKYWKLKDGSYTTDDPATPGMDQDKYDSITTKYALVKSTTKTIINENENRNGVKKTTGADGVVTFSGLAEGTYTITETGVPAGYNGIDPISTTITFTYDSVEKVWNFHATNVDDDGDNTFSVKIKNNKGVELPSTGGIGTTIFYILGGLLVVGAAVILVARRKASN